MIHQFFHLICDLAFEKLQQWGFFIWFLCNSKTTIEVVVVCFAVIVQLLWHYEHIIVLVALFLYTYYIYGQGMLCISFDGALSIHISLSYKQSANFLTRVCRGKKDLYG